MCADFSEKSLETVARGIPYDSQSAAHNRALVLLKVFDYLSENLDKLNSGKAAVVGEEHILLGHHVLQTLHHFLIWTHPKDWGLIPSPDYITQNQNSN